MDRREGDARATLRDLGVRQTFSTRWGDAVILAAGVAGAAVLGLLPKIYPHVFADFSGLAPLAFATAAAVVALRQWRHLRNEVTITGALGRLDLVNRYYLDADRLPAVQAIFQEDDGEAWYASISDQQRWAQDMYVFVELDNLQYGLEKFRLGYSSAYQALRTVDQYASRCQSDVFHEAALRLVRPKAGSYTAETVEVVERIQPGQRLLPHSRRHGPDEPGILTGEVSEDLDQPGGGDVS